MTIFIAIEPYIIELNVPTPDPPEAARAAVAAKTIIMINYYNLI